MSAKLDVKAFSLSAGILWSLSILVMGVSAMVCGWAGKFVSAVAPFYVGYSASVVGSIIGAVWAFFDAAIGCALWAWLYNKLAK
ncbi:MAG: bacteriophage holin [Candidatus Omnitrophica bacterium]|nr:bacteriophage holin [Candidatus Omnitrophota bacterium]